MKNLNQGESNVRPIRIGTRASLLALWQAEWCAARLQEAGIPVEIVKMTASGDRPETFAQPIPTGGSQGIFSKEIQDALLANEVDLAVHSLKDLPTESVPGIQLVAVPERAEVEDVLVAGKSERTAAKFQTLHSLADLPDGTILGTSSLRRRAQLLAFARSHGKKWEILPIRGNLNTRFKKLDSGEYDALILARAGVERLEMTERVSAVLPIEEMFPAVSQGALGLETRADDDETKAAVRRVLNDETVFACVLAERTLLKVLDGGCATPIGGLCRWNEETQDFTIRGRVIALDGRTFLEGTLTGADPQTLAVQLAESLIQNGADALIREARNA
ncbi:MAG: hydroxymethylbilane synthase [Thermoguttaceae bacterium]|nr:hydroxymethylbilane synthase [Planctomycetaceae bacterium]MBQ4143084.1 hydroxymethylbilane synthase [Thermoguttaceae bacterium]